MIRLLRVSLLAIRGLLRCAKDSNDCVDVNDTMSLAVIVIYILVALILVVNL